MAMSSTGLLVPPMGDLHWQQHVVHHRQVGQQIELLKDNAHGIGPKSISGNRRQGGHGLAQDLAITGSGQHHAGQQGQQGTLAAATGATHKQRLPSLKGQGVNPQQGGLTRPGIDQL
jgi:hypothetical protein